MRFLIIFALSILCPLLASADVHWHKFGIGTISDKVTISLGHVTLTVEPQKVQTSGFPDDLTLTVHTPGAKARQYDFTSTYGYGEVAIHGDVLLLKYGVGRGTSSREDHVKALRLDYYFHELADVSSSCYVLTNHHNAAPDLFVYKMKIVTAGGYTTLSFWLPKPQKGIPSEKTVKWKNDA